MLNLNSILIGSENAKALGAFYGKVLEREADMVEGEYMGFVAGKTFLSIGPHDKVKGQNQNPERVILNFETSEVQEEFDRIKAIEGAKVIAEPYKMGEWDGLIATFADPDGNYFQLMTPWEEKS